MNVIKAMLILAAGVLVILSASGVFKLPGSIEGGAKQVHSHAHRIKLIRICSKSQDSLIEHSWNRNAGYPGK